MSDTIKQSEFEIHVRTHHTAVRVPLFVYAQIQSMAKEEGINYTQAILYLVQRGLKQYIHKKGTFFCQCCSKTYPSKKMHMVNIASEDFIVCDNCFFTDKYKEFIKKIL